MAHLEQEQLHVINLSPSNGVLSAPMIYQGTVDAIYLRVAEVFRPAILDNATALYVAHNHPGGEPEPNPEDRLVTERIIAAGRLLDIAVIDHLVIGRSGFFSMRDAGIGFDPLPWRT